MRSAPFIAKRSTVNVLAGIALVLFCVTFLRFVTLTFADEAPRHATSDAPAYLDREIEQAEADLNRALRRIVRHIKRERGPWWTRCGSEPSLERFRRAEREALEARRRLHRLQQQRRHEATVKRELSLRAAQRPEEDPALRNRLGLGETAPQVPILR